MKEVAWEEDGREMGGKCESEIVKRRFLKHGKNGKC